MSNLSEEDEKTEENTDHKMKIHGAEKVYLTYQDSYNSAMS